MATRREFENESEDRERCRAEFAASGYGIVRAALAADTARIGSQYIRILRDYYQSSMHFDQIQQSHGRYNDPFGESVLAELAPGLATLTGLELLPTYSFSRIYGNGGELRKHVDRPSCEVSATLLLDSDILWPIGVEVEGEEREIELNPGDLMVYRSCRIPHWRKPFTGEYSAHNLPAFRGGRGGLWSSGL